LFFLKQIFYLANFSGDLFLFLFIKSSIITSSKDFIFIKFPQLAKAIPSKSLSSLKDATTEPLYFSAISFILLISPSEMFL
jgi:hypothetical protein